MITVFDIKKSYNELLKRLFEFPVYGNEVKEGYKRPSFFVQILPIRDSPKSIHETMRSYSVVTTFLQEKVDEVQQLSVYERIKNELGLCLIVNSRHLPIDDIGFQMVGEYSNILQISFSISFVDILKVKDTDETMREIIIEEKMEVE